MAPGPAPARDVRGARPYPAQPEGGLFRFLEHQGAGNLWLLVAVLLLLIGLGDLVTGLNVRLFVLYFIPIAVAGWYLDTRSSLATAVGATLLWVASEVAGGRTVPTAFIWIWNIAAMAAVFGMVAMGVSRMRKDRDYFRRLANHDALTGLLNGPGFRRALTRELERIKRYGHPLTVAYIDLDNFKQVNDAQGHPAGDRLLRQVGQTIGTRIRRLDAAGRLGGDEFAILFPETTPKGGLTAVEELRDAISEAPLIRKSVVTLSIGLATFFNPPQGGVEEVIQTVDRLMYESKEAGRNRITVARSDNR